MNDFDRRWQQAAKIARQVPVPQQQAPEVFADAVVSHISTNLLVLPRPEQVWMRQGWRALIGVAALLVLCILADSLALSHETTSFLPQTEPGEIDLPWMP